MLNLLRLNEKSPPKSEMPSLICYGYWGETTRVAEQNGSIERIYFLCYIPLIKKEQIVSFITNMKDFLGSRSGLLRSPSLTKDAAQTLREMILLETLLPGTALPERDLSQALRISRTPLRETIRLLAGDGLVQYTPAHHLFVTDPSLDKINNYLRIQGALEALPGQQACAEASTQEIAQIAKINEGIVDTRNDGTRLSAFQADMQFHESIVKAAKTPPLAETHAKYNAHLRRKRFLSSQRLSGRESTQQEHHIIVKALVARDTDQTSFALKTHLETAEKNSVGDERPHFNNGYNN